MKKKVTLAYALRRRIKNLAHSRNYSMNKFCKKCGVSYSTLNSFLTGRCSSITTVTLYQICSGFGITMKQFFDDETFQNLVEDWDTDTDNIHYVEEHPKLTEAQKRKLEIERRRAEFMNL